MKKIPLVTSHHHIPLGASKDCILQSYKKLAFKWHPEKYTTTKNTQEALKVNKN